MTVCAALAARGRHREHSRPPAVGLRRWVRCEARAWLAGQLVMSMDKASQRGAEVMGRSPPIVGRSAERVLLREQLIAVREPHGQFCILSGEAGIGKTTLIREMVDEAHELGMAVLVGQCYDLMAAPPYGLWLDLASSYRVDEDAVPLPDALSQERAGAITSQSEVFASVQAFLSAISANAPTLVVLEDIHWADPVSIELLRYISTHLRDLRLCLVITYRVDELTARNPLYRQLPALIRESGGLRIELGRLRPEDLVTLVQTRYPMAAEDQARLVDFLIVHSEGNPFFAMELLRALEHRGQDGGLWRDGQGWALGELAELVVPTLVRQVIDIRLARLGPEVREPLALAAMIGQDVPFELWQRLAGLDDAAMLRLVETAIEWHVVVASADGTRMHFVHALTREALYEGILPPRRRLLHRDVADALMDQPAVDPDPVAYHLQRAGDPRTAGWMIRAAERAQRAYAWLTARDRFAAAADALADIPGEELARARLHYRCGRLLRYADAVRGIDDLRLARRLADLAGDDVLAGEATYSLGLVQIYADEWTQGVTDMVAGIERVEAIPLDDAAVNWSRVTWLADALPAIEAATTSGIDEAAAKMAKVGVNHRRGGLPWFYADAGHLELALKEADAFLPLAHACGSGPLVQSASGHANFGVGIAKAALGDPAGARNAFRHAREIYREIDHHGVIAFVYIAELLDVALRYGTTDLDERQRLADEAQAALERGGGALPPDISLRRVHLPLMWIGGEWDEAQRIAAEGTTHGNYVLRRPLTAAMAPIAFHQGRWDDAWSLIHEVLPAGPGAMPGSAVLADALMLQPLAVQLAVSAEDHALAADWLEANRRWLQWSGAIAGQVEHHVAAACLELARDDTDAAMCHAAQAVDLSASPLQPLARIDALRVRGTVAGMLGDRERACADFQDALALADQCRAPFERARVLVEMAQVTGDLSGSPKRPRIATRLHAAPLLQRIDVLLSREPSSTGSGLTARELEVLRYAAQGLTDAEIGERLFISHRTVSQHLRSVYGKLHVRSRAAATRFAVEHQLG